MTTPGSTTSALATHVDLAATICALAGVDPAAAVAAATGCRASTSRRCWPTRPRRCATTSCSPRTRPRPPNLNKVRYALRGFFDGTTKYARYYGVGGGKPSTGLWGKSTRAQALRRRLRLRRPRPRVVRPRHRSPRAGQPGQRPLPPDRAPRPLRADARLRGGVVRRFPGRRARLSQRDSPFGGAFRCRPWTKASAGPGRRSVRALDEDQCGPWTKISAGRGRRSVRAVDEDLPQVEGVE